ncbi:MAG: hypothetical protein NZ805_16445, partial [Armatimonadetes bacterium]|nr:hypothetical protein [Armatimonadota bacterium]
MIRFTSVLWLLFVIASFLCFWGSHKSPLFDTDEPRYAQAAKEMMERGDLILPTFNGQPRYAKPALAAIVIAFILYFALKPSFGWETGLMASLFWLTSLGTLIFAHAAITDMVLTAFMTGSIVSLWFGVKNWRPYWFLLASL